MTLMSCSNAIQDLSIYAIK